LAEVGQKAEKKTHVFAVYTINFLCYN